MEAGNCPCIKLVKVLLKKLQNDLFKVIIRALDNCLQTMKDRTHRHLSEKNDIIDIKPEYVPAIPGRRMAKIIRKKDGSYEPNAIDFSLCALRIWDDCAQKKCLKPDTYFFNERLMQCKYSVNRVLPIS